MSLGTKLANASANAEADAIARLLDSGYLRLYSGTRPADADTALAGNTLLAELRFSATSAGAASGGVITANGITSDSDADATGTATFARLFKSDGTTVVMDQSVGSGGTKSITAATNANPVALTKASHGLVTGDQIYISGATGNWAAINGWWLVERVDANTVQIDVDSTSLGALAGSPVYRDADIDMNTASIVQHATVSMSSWTYTARKAP